MGQLEGSDEICRLGKNQSPLIFLMKSLIKTWWSNAYDVEVENNGHTIEVTTNEKILLATMRIGNDHYELTQFFLLNIVLMESIMMLKVILSLE